MAEREKILEVRDLSISFTTTGGELNAIRGVDLDVYRGETVAIVGESGSGKSVTVKAAMGIMDKNARVNSGSIKFWYYENEGASREKREVDLLKMPVRDIRSTINGRRIAMVFQDPMTSLDPTMNIGDQIMEGMIWHYKTPKQEAYQKAVQLLELVGITDAEKRMKNFPHQLSGGMRQRVVIAIALACDPDLLICDEPTTALDVTIQARILELIKEIQAKMGISVIYITHDLGVVAKVADYVNVMYAGKIVEQAEVHELFRNPLHPYTNGLLRSLPKMQSGQGRLYNIRGMVPDLVNMPEGCRFAARCDQACDRCCREMPELIDVGGGHLVRCFRQGKEDIHG